MKKCIVSGKFINNKYKNLYHFSEEPIALLKTVYHPTVFSRIDNKPFGLWFSNESAQISWSKFCKEEEFNLEALKYKHKIIFKNTAKILFLNTIKDIDNFTQEFAVEDKLIKKFYEIMESEITQEFSTKNYIELPKISPIDWNKVYQICDVIFISPYYSSRRLIK